MASKYLLSILRSPAVAAKCEFQHRFCSSFSNIIVSKRGEKQNVGLIQLNRPKALNSLNTPLMEELIAALRSFQDDDAIGCAVITGNEKAFAGRFKVLAFGLKCKCFNFVEFFGLRKF